MSVERPYLIDLLRFLRWPNLLLITLFLLLFDQVVLGVLRNALDVGAALDGFTRVLLILDVLIVTVVGYWMNDLSDVDADSINRPTRFLVLRPNAVGQVRAWTLVLSVMGLSLTILLAYLLNRLEWVWLYPSALFGLYLYARRGKGWGIWGNAFVSFMIAVLPLLWVIAESEMINTLHAADPHLFKDALQMFAGYAGLMFLSNMARELAKDVQDLAGDRAMSGKTLPLKKGLGVANMVMIIYVLMIACAQTALVAMLPRSLVLSVFSVIIFAMLLVIVRWMQRMGIEKAAVRVSNGLKWLMLIGLLQLFFLPPTLL